VWDWDTFSTYITVCTLTNLLRATHCVTLNNILRTTQVLKLRTNSTTMAPSSDGDNGGDDDPPASFKLGEHRIRLDFLYTDTDNVPNVPAALFEICKMWKQRIDDIQFVDHAGEVIEMDNWPLKPTFKDRFSIQVVEARKRHIMAGMILRSKTKFGDLKAAIRPVLERLSVWLHPHPLAFTQLDVVPLGFIPFTHPRFHSPARISDDIHDIIFDNYHYLTDDFRHRFESDNADLFDDDNTVVPPSMIIAPTNINSGDEQSRAFEIQVERKDIQATRQLLEAIFCAVDPKSTPHRFIPYSLKYDSPDTFRSALRTQNAYLDNHRNIPLAGITIEQMQEVISWDMEDRSPFDIISALPGVTRVDTNARTHDLGRFNISVTNETYSANCNWIDSKLAALFERTTPTDKLDNSDFPNPVRMGRRQNRRTARAPRNTEYTDYLKSQYQTTVGTPPPKKPKTNAWHTRRVEPSFDYDVHYPAIQPPTPQPTRLAVTPTGLHHTPTPSPPATPATLSTATPSTMTDAETRQFIAECVQTEQTKLAASTALIAADITQLRAEFKTMLHESKTTQATTMQGYIRDAISANTKSLTDEGTSPFVTQAELGRQLSQFKTDL
jgi:hypothetical protein